MDKEALNKAAQKAIEHWSNEEFEQAESLFHQTLPFVDDNYWRSVDYLSYFACNQNSLGKVDEAKTLFGRSLKSALDTIKPSLAIECNGKYSLLLLYARLHMDKGNADAVEKAANEYLQLRPDEEFKTLKAVLERIRNWQ